MEVPTLGDSLSWDTNQCVCDITTQGKGAFMLRPTISQWFDNKMGYFQHPTLHLARRVWHNIAGEWSDYVAFPMVFVADVFIHVSDKICSGCSLWITGVWASHTVERTTGTPAMVKHHLLFVYWPGSVGASSVADFHWLWSVCTPAIISLCTWWVSWQCIVCLRTIPAHLLSCLVCLPIVLWSKAEALC